MWPRLSIIVPIYNVEKYLTRCIESLLKQAVDSKEILLIDDGSTDGSPKICDEYAQNYEFIKVLHKKNAGLGYARNSGLDLAKGKYVAFVDSDDEVENDHFCKLLESVEFSEADACLSGMTDIYENFRIECPHTFAGRTFDKKGIQNELLPSMLGYDLYGDNYSGMSVCRGIYSRNLIEKNTIRFRSEREYISEDILFDIEFMKVASKVSVIGGTGYYYYHNAASLTTKYKPDRFEESKKLYLFENELIIDCDNYDDMWQRIASMFLSNIRVSMMHETIQNSFYRSYLRNREITNDDIVRNLIKNYDYSKMPNKQRLLCIAMSKKSYIAIQLMALMQGKKYRKSLIL